MNSSTAGAIVGSTMRVAAAKVSKMVEFWGAEMPFANLPKFRPIHDETSPVFI